MSYLQAEREQLGKRGYHVPQRRLSSNSASFQCQALSSVSTGAVRNGEDVGRQALGDWQGWKTLERQRPTQSDVGF